MPLERIGLCNPTHESMVHICCAYGAYNSLINYVNSRSDTFFIGSTEKLLIKASNKAWSVFAEAYRAEAQGFKVYAPCYSLPAWLEWRLNTEDPTQTESALIFPEPICNLTDSVANESESDPFSNFLANVELPANVLLDHTEHLAQVDVQPGSPHTFDVLSDFPGASYSSASARPPD